MASDFFVSATYYYKFKGEINTEHVLGVAIKRAVERNIDKIVVASETGRSAIKALSIIKKLGANLKLIVVTHPIDKTWGPKGDILVGLMHPKYKKIRDCLERSGAIIICGTRPFAPASRSIGWDKSLPDAIIDKVLGNIFGQGIKIAIEVALMATDAGVVKRGEVVVSLGGTYKGLDSAIIARTTYSYYFLKEFEVLEIIAKPYEPHISLPEFNDPSWKGDISKYYEEPRC